MQGIIPEWLSGSISRNTKDKADDFKSRKPSSPEAKALVVTREPPRLLQCDREEAILTSRPRD